MHQLGIDRRFTSQGGTLIDHYKTDWPYWGGDNPTEAENPFGDMLDIIEITNLNLKINLSNC